MELMLESEDISRVLSGLDLLYQWPNVDFSSSLSMLLSSSDSRVYKAALRALSVWPDNNISDISELLKSYLKWEDHSVREMAVNCLSKLEANEREGLAQEMLEDVHPEVRMAAVKILFDEEENKDVISNWMMTHNGSPRSKETILHYLFIRNPARTIMESLTHYLADDAVQLLFAHNELMNVQIKGDALSAEVEILDFALAERVRELIDLALLAAGKIEDPYTIGAIRAGVKSKENHHWAKSCEAVRYIQDKKLAKALTVLLEQLGSDDTKPSKLYAPTFSGSDSILHWLIARNDPWITECVQQVEPSLIN